MNCGECVHRNGNFCKELDERLEIVSVEGTVLEFEKAKDCKHEV